MNPAAMKTKQIKFVVSKTISHPMVDQPISKEESFESGSLAEAVKMLNISGKQACDLKNYRKTTWTDEMDRTHTLELKGGEILLLDV